MTALASLSLGVPEARAADYTGATYLGSNLGYVSPQASLDDGSSYSLYNSYSYGSSFGSFNPFAGLGPNGTSGTGTEIGVALFDFRFLFGAVMDAALENGLPVQLRVTDARFTGFLRLGLRVEVTSAVGAKRDLCPDGGLAYILPRSVVGATGAIEESEGIDFACLGSTVAKCIDYGYDPWSPRTFDLHRACVRMLRADYCGDGRSFTEDGTLIGINDPSGIQTDAGQALATEAVWGPNGAVCVERTRSDARDACIDALLQPSCDTSEALLVSSIVVEADASETPPAPEDDNAEEQASTVEEEDDGDESKEWSWTRWWRWDRHHDDDDD